MRALVIYESIYGNTQRVAVAIGSGLSGEADATLFEVGDAPDLTETRADLVVVGGPTHAFAMSRSRSRHDAIERSDEPTISQTGIRDWIKSQSNHDTRVPVATFDTRLKMPRRLTGSAARNAEKKLRKLGFKVVSPAQSFFVEGETGPLHDGEQDRAFQWGETLPMALMISR